jgi:hypothetical protein
MSHQIETRDIQIARENAWHGKTTIREEVLPTEAHPYELIESPIYYKVAQANEAGVMEDVMVESPTFKQLIASDDFLPVGDPYGSTYHPSNIEKFWNVVKKGMGETPYEIVSAGSVDDRRKIFASLKVSEGFRVGDREFKDYINIIDSFDKSTSFTTRYNNVCIVCANTFAASMQMGDEVGKAKHTLNLDVNIERLIKAINAFVGTSSHYKTLLTEAEATPCSRDEARSWLMGVEGRNAKLATNGMKQKSARMVELFDNGKGNEGRTRLDAFSAATDFHSNESTNRKEGNAQFMTSEFGSSAAVKQLVVSNFRQDWDKYVRHGESLLNEALVS